MWLLFLALTVFFTLVYMHSFSLAKNWTLIDSFVIGVGFYQVGACILVYDVGLDPVSYRIILSSSFCYFLATTIGYFFRLRVADPSLYQRIYYAPNSVLRSQLFGISVFALVLVNLGILTVIIITFKDLFTDPYDGMLLDVRKQISGGERGYLWPGLIKQIRDIMSLSLICYGIFFFKSRQSRVAVFLLLACTLAAIVVGGQRFTVIVLFLSVAIAVYVSSQSRTFVRDNKGVFLLLAFASAFAVLALNTALGRSDFSIHGAYQLFAGIVDRIFYTVPHENYRVAEYFEGLTLPYFSIWTSELASLMPGVRYTLSNEMHAFIGGSSQGNSTLGGALSGYYNFGYAGVFLYVASMILVLYWAEKITALMRSRLLYSLRVVLFLMIPMWYSYFLMFLNGFLVFLLYFFLSVLYSLVVTTAKKQRRMLRPNNG